MEVTIDLKIHGLLDRIDDVYLSTFVVFLTIFFEFSLNCGFCDLKITNMSDFSNETLVDLADFIIR
jgi:hypothetical protein